jgi:hypothetical protein
MNTRLPCTVSQVNGHRVMSQMLLIISSRFKALRADRTSNIELQVNAYSMRVSGPKGSSHAAVRLLTSVTFLNETQRFTEILLHHSADYDGQFLMDHGCAR